MKESSTLFSQAQTSLFPQQRENQNNHIPQTFLCSNIDCLQPHQAQPLKKIKFLNKEAEFCQNCFNAIQNQWVCLYCNKIFMESHNKADNSEWIGCDSSLCGRWTHISCEEQKGICQIKCLLKDKSYKYSCPNCRNIKPKNKLDKYRNKKQTKMGNQDEVRKIMITKKKQTNVTYHYLYSDSYKSIEKLLNANNKQSLVLDDNEMNEDLTKINSILGKNIFQKNYHKRRTNVTMLTKRNNLSVQIQI